MQIHAYFYINYVIYSGLLIFCLKEQFLIEFSTRKITGKGVHFRCSYAYVHVFKGSDTSAADRRALWPRSSLPHTEATPPTWLHQQDSCHARHTCKKANLHKADWPSGQDGLALFLYLNYLISISPNHSSNVSFVVPASNRFPSSQFTESEHKACKLSALEPITAAVRGTERNDCFFPKNHNFLKMYW